MKNVLNYYSLLCFIIGSFIIRQEVNAQLQPTANGKFVYAKGLKIYYEDTGRGVPIVLLHGFGGTAFAWNSYKQDLAKFFRVIAIDLPGHGRSDYMDTTIVYLHKRAAEYLLAMMDTLKIDSTYIMGSSSGGMIALYMASINPQLVKKIIVIGGQVYYSTITRDFIASQVPPIENKRQMENRIRIHGEQKAILLARQFWNFRKLYGDPSITPDMLSAIKAKALIIHGDKDPIAPVSNAWEMYRNISGAYLWVVPNGGHSLNLIRDNDENNSIQRVLDFLKGNWEKNN